MQHVGIKPGEKLEIELLPGGEFRGRAVRKKGKISDLAGCLKGKTNGVRLTHRRDGRGHRRSGRRRVPERCEAMRMIADTNVLLRFVLNDDPEHSNSRSTRWRSRKP